jgi:CHASE2 domain-containing sensor protein
VPQIVIQTPTVAQIVNGTITKNANIPVGDDKYENLVFLLNFTAAGLATGSVQIFIQDSTDGGVTWDDLVSSNLFVFGAALSSQKFIIAGSIAPATQAAAAALVAITEGGAPQQEALAAGSVRHGPFGNLLRVREKVTLIAGGPTGATYTINATAR